MLPSSNLLSFGVIIGTYLTRAASNYARDRGESKESAMGLFNGTFFGIFQVRLFDSFQSYRFCMIFNISPFGS